MSSNLDEIDGSHASHRQVLTAHYRSWLPESSEYPRLKFSAMLRRMAGEFRWWRKWPPFLFGGDFVLLSRERGRRALWFETSSRIGNRRSRAFGNIAARAEVNR